jgi:hypothetical protein
MDDPDKLTNAVETCVAYAITADRPFKQVSDFLLLLKNAKWTEGEILEVQTRVLDALRKRTRR